MLRGAKAVIISLVLIALLPSALFATIWGSAILLIAWAQAYKNLRAVKKRLA